MPRKKKAVQEEVVEEEDDGLADLVSAFTTTKPQPQQQSKAKPKPKPKPAPQVPNNKQQQEQKSKPKPEQQKEKEKEDDGWTVVTEKQRKTNKDKQTFPVVDNVTFPPSRHCGRKMPSLKKLILEWSARNLDKLQSSIRKSMLLPSLKEELVVEMRKANALNDEGVVLVCSQLSSLSLLGASHLTSSTLITAISQCPTLNSINLSYCFGVTDDVLEALAKHCPHLRELRLSGCYRVTDEGVKHLGALTELQSLHLGGSRNDLELLEAYFTWDAERCDCTITRPPSVGLTNKGLLDLAVLPQLHTLNLSCLPCIYVSGFTEFLNSTKSGSTLTKLNMSGLQFVEVFAGYTQPGEPDPLMKLLSDKCPSLTCLSLESNRTLSQEGAEGWDGLFPNLRRFDKPEVEDSSLLKFPQLRHWRVTAETLSHVPANKEVEELKIADRVSFTEENAKAFAELPITRACVGAQLYSVLNLERLTYLEVDANPAITWKEIFSRCKSLETLQVDGSLSESAWLFRETDSELYRNTLLKKLVLKGRQATTDPSILPRIAALFPNLEYVHLYFASRSEVPVPQTLLSRFVARCPLIRKLLISWPLSPASFEVLAKGLPYLTLLKMHFPKSVAKEIVPAVMCCRYLNSLKKLGLYISAAIPTGVLNQPERYCDKKSFTNLATKNVNTFLTVKKLWLNGFVPGISYDVARRIAERFPMVSYVALQNTYGDYRAELEQTEEISRIFISSCPRLRTLALDGIWEPKYIYRAEPGRKSQNVANAKKHIKSRVLFKQEMAAKGILFMNYIDHWESYREDGGFCSVSEDQLDRWATDFLT